MTWCWIYPLGYTRQDLIIQGSHQYCWCKLLLCCSGHIDISHQEHLWCLTYIFHWWRCFMLIYCWQDTIFHQYQILLQQPVWYLPHALCWNYVCCERTIIGLYLWWVTSTRLLIMIYKKNEPIRWDIIPLCGGDAHHETAWLILNIHQCLLLSSSIRGVVTVFSLLNIT